MSISNRHQVVKFVAGKSEPLTDQRLSKVGYKTTTKNPAKFASVCASVPVIAGDEILTRMEDLIPYVRTMLENAQDGIFRSLYESSGGLLNAISDEDIGLNACISFMESENNGGRLTKEFLDAWCKANVVDNLSVVIADKLGFTELTPENETVIARHVKGYVDMITGLSGGKTFYQPNQIKAIRKTLDVATADDEVSKKLIARLDSMEKKEKIEDLLEL